MKVEKKEVRMVEREVTVESYTLCDKCNKKIKRESCYDAFRCEFAHKTGGVYPEGGYGELQQMDLCQTCAVGLVVLLRENGYRVNDSEWD